MKNNVAQYFYIISIALFAIVIVSHLVEYVMYGKQINWIIITFDSIALIAVLLLFLQNRKKNEISTG